MKAITYLLILIMISFSTILGQGFFNKLKERVGQTIDRVTQSNTYERIERSVEQIDPKEYITRMINSRLNISNPLIGLKGKLTEIQKIVEQKFSPFTADNTNVKMLFRKTNIPINEIVNLDFIQSLNPLLGNTIMIVNGRSYSAYLIGDKILIQSDDKLSIPLNDDLQKGIKILSYKANVNKLNTVYFQNLRNISQIVYSVSAASFNLSSLVERKLRDLSGIEYMGVTAIQVLDPITEASTGGISYSDIVEFANSFNGASERTMVSARNIQNAAADISANILRINRNVVDYNYIVELENDLNTISSEIRNLSENINEITSTIRSTSGDFTRLADISQFEFFSTIGNALNELSTFTSNASVSLNNYANKINGYANENNNFALTISNNSRDYFVSLLKSNYGEIIESEKFLITNFAELNSNLPDLSLNNKSNYSTYINTLKTMDENYESNINNNIITTLQTLNEIKSNLEGFPKGDYEKYTNSIAEVIKDKQLFSSPDQNNYLTAARKIKELNLKSFSNTKLLNASLFSMWDEVRDSNKNFYIILSLLAIGIIVVGIVIIKKRRN